MSTARPAPVALDAAGLRIALVAARFNGEITGALVDGAREALRGVGARDEDVRVLWVPGALEIPVVLEALARGGAADLLVALGCVVRGETPHFEHVAGQCAAGVAAVSRAYTVPIGFGVLTVDSAEQARDRAGGRRGNTGAEAALAAVETAQVLRAL
jgi:6,7-dimethyl-8-ribityllumazine synthase